MRFAIVLVLAAACSTTDSFHDEACPTTLSDGQACSFSGRCWSQDDFSSCNSGWCTCEAGRVSCHSIEHGDACGDEPIDQCSTEGNPSCSTLPTSGGCSCNEGTWRCSCYCYGAQTTCSIDPCNLYPMSLGGAYCSEHGRVCTYPGGNTCTCEDLGQAEWQFICRGP